MRPPNFPEPIFEHLTVEDGLPENSVRCILQDHLGYMWFGTQNGLVKYDGYNMTVYQPEPDDSLSISWTQIMTIYEDKSGTLWVGTLGGLNRFNRSTETFTRFMHNPDDSTSINSNNVFSCYEDNESFIRIYYEGSVYSPAVYEYILSLIANGKRISSLLKVGDKEGYTKTFTIDKETIVLTVIMEETGYNACWLENANGEKIAGQKKKNVVYLGRHTNDQIKIVIDTLKRGSYRLRYVSYRKWSYNSWRDIPPDYQDFGGIQVIELPEDQKNVSEIINDIEPAILGCFALAIIEDQLTGNLYVGGRSKLLFYDADKQLLKDFNRNAELKSKLGGINTFHQSPDGTIWIGHSMGLSKFNSVENSIKLYQPIPSVTYKPVNHFTSLIEDNNGLIWGANDFSVWDTRIDHSGQIIFNPVNERFKTYKHDPNKQGSLSGNPVWSVYKDNSGIIWVGTGWAGVNKWDRNKHKFERFSYDPNNPDGERINSVRTIIEDQEGIIWFGTETRGLVRFNPVLNTYHFYFNDPNDSTSISYNRIGSIIPDENDILWIGTIGGGLNKFDRKTGAFIRYNNENNLKDPNNGNIQSVFRDQKGTLWLGHPAHSGLLRFDQFDEFFKSIYFDGGRKVATAFYEDQKENFWLGTWHNGIYLFDRSKEIPIYNITQKDGLANNQVRSMLGDDSGNLWIGTDNGLSKFDPKTRTIKNYFTQDGFEGNRYTTNSSYKTSTGEMLFGTTDGFIMFHPASIKDDPVPPQVVISDVSLFNRPGEKLTFDGFISELEALDLSYNENDLSFDYIGLHFGDPQKNQYKYMLVNFDDDWVEAGTQRNATYTNLDAGEYVFRVTACNKDGVWNEKGKSILVIITPPLWKTWWAYSLYVLFGLGLLYSIRHYEQKRTQLKNQVKLDDVKLKEREETDRLKSRFFANISHEFRTPLTLILGPSENILTEAPSENATKQASTIKRNAIRLLGLISQLLDLSKLEAGKLELKASKSNIISFIKGITMSFESVAEGKDITLKVIPEKEQIELYFDREKMTKIMTNILSNTFKFTPEGGEITVKVGHAEPALPVGRLVSASSFSGEIPNQSASGGRNDEIITISVKDTGQGIAEEEIPKLFDRFYQVDSSQTREHEGTGIGLALTKEPLGREHLKDEEIVTTNETLDQKEILIGKEDYNLRTFSESDAVPDESKTIILVVEDNYDMREYIKESLSDSYEVEEAVNGEQGVRIAEKIIPDLIISDIMMPKIDGNELTRKLKNDEKTCHIPIILLTAKAEQESKLEGLETGADDYLTKPFDTKELQLRIKNLINLRIKLQQKFSSDEIVATKGKEKKLSGLDEKFIKKVTEVIENHISEEEFNIEDFGKEVGMSRMQIYRKLKALTGKSATHYIRSVKLFKAKEMLGENEATISEIAYSLGFSSPSYFTRCFREEFGYPPSDLVD